MVGRRHAAARRRWCEPRPAPRRTHRHAPSIARPVQRVAAAALTSGAQRRSPPPTPGRHAAAWLDQRSRWSHGDGRQLEERPFPAAQSHVDSAPSWL
eukprot:scaffold96866_cov62-Phaeocystis_antarctica.AAC.5